MKRARQAVCVVSEVRGLREAMTLRGLPVGDFHFLASPPDAAASQLLSRCEVLVGDPPLCGPLVDRCPQLVWFQSTFAGCNQLLTASTRRDYTATRLASVFGPDMAEYAALQVLALERRYAEARACQSRRDWAGARGVTGQYRRLPQLTLGVLGLGDIGSCVARTFAQGFSMKVLGCRRSPPASAQGSAAAAASSASGGGAAGGNGAHVSEVFGMGRLGEFLAACDYVVSVLPSTPETRGLLDGDVLRACAARRAVLINVGRGDLLSEETILRALDGGWLRHYVGDVFAPEPLPSGSKLWAREDVTITPHVSAVSMPDDVATAFADNLRRYEEGGTAALKHVFGWERGY